MNDLRSYLNKLSQIESSNHLTASNYAVEIDELSYAIVEHINSIKTNFVLTEDVDNIVLNNNQLQNFFIKLVQASNAKRLLGSLKDYDSSYDGTGEMQQKLQNKMKDVFSKIISKETEQVETIKSTDEISPTANWYLTLKQKASELKEKSAIVEKNIKDNTEAKQILSDILGYVESNPILIPVALAGLTTLALLFSVPTSLAIGGTITAALAFIKSSLQSDEAAALTQQSDELLDDPEVKEAMANDPEWKLKMGIY